jgi:Protein of unknown function (DUF1194)
VIRRCARTPTGVGALLSLGLVLGGATAAIAQEVDLQLLFAVDISGSVDEEEYSLQMQGLANAFRHPDVIRAIQGSAPRGLAVALLQWAGFDEQYVVVPWMTIDEAHEAVAFADRLDGAPRPMTYGGTALGNALAASVSLIRTPRIAAARQAIDVSGDGRTNQGFSPGPVRAYAASLGITVNGLAILNEESDLLKYYASRVIGGPGAFVMQADDFEDFALAIRLKLIREIEGSIVAEGSVEQSPYGVN